jgi:hypothetical protein
MNKRGSILLITLFTVSLLLMIVLAMVVFVRLELRTVSQHQQGLLARTNARLGVELGLARLQELLGPDARITAPAGLFDAEPNTPEIAGLRHPWLTGVWHARSETLDQMPDYGIEAPFLQWLVSAGDEGALRQTAFPANGFLGNPVLVVGSAGSDGGSPTNSDVVAGRISSETGRFAWWVGDENMKARINLAEKTGRGLSARPGDLLASYATPGVYGVQAVAGFDSFPANTWQSDRLYSLESLGLLHVDERTRGGGYFHHLTPNSESVLADVTRGGLRKDLSLYLERRDIDWLQPWGRAYDITTEPKGPLGPNGEIALSNPREYDVLSWKFLHHWYNMHRRQIGHRNNLPIAHMQNYDEVPLDPVSNPGWNSGVMRITPVMVRMQVIFSYHAIQKTPVGAGPEGTATWDIHLNVYPVVTLWNPHNVGLEQVRYSVWLHTFPLEHTVYLNGKKVELSGNGAKNGTYTWGYPTGEFLFHWGDTTPSIQLAPGEAKHYTAEDKKGKIFQMQERLRPWLPPPTANLDGGRFGITRVIGTVTAKPADRIAIETSGDSWHTSGQEFNLFQTTFCFRAEARHSHRAHPPRFRQQMFSSQVAWRREVDQGNPVSAFISRANFNSRTLAEMNNLPNPFLDMDLRLKSLDEAQLPNKTWLHNIPSHPFAAATSTQKHGSLGVGEQTTFFAHPYTVTFEQVNTLAGRLQNKPYFGPSYTPAGLTSIVAQEIPMAPLTSLAQLQHLPLYPIEGLNWNNYHYQHFAIGNSQALPGLLPAEIKRNSFPFYLGQYFAWQGGDIAGKLYTDDTSWFNNADYVIDAAPAATIDRSYAANHLLFDSYFFSSMAAREGYIFQQYGSPRTLREVVAGFYKDGEALPNRAYRARVPSGMGADTLVDSLVSPSGEVRNDAYLKSAAALLTTGGFNVNSTSVPAWTAMLASSHLKRPVVMRGGQPREQDEARFVVSRFTMPIGGAAGNDAGRDAEAARWQGYRELTAEEIRQLAEAMVMEVKRRGPFRSLGEFVNRRRSTDPALAVHGALQAALENPGVDINKRYRDNVLTKADVQAARYVFPEAATGPRYQGTPAYVSQADILNTLAPVMQVRSDTFLIRGYGEIPGPDGGIGARALCDAVVQRLPEYLDPADAPQAAFGELTSTVNRRYGRKFIVKSFRWLEPPDQHENQQ